MKALLYNAVKEVLKSNKRFKAKASSESSPEDEQEHFNFEILKIGEELRKALTPHSDAAEMPETGTEAEKELYKIIYLINPKINKLHTCTTRKCKRKTW